MTKDVVLRMEATQRYPGEEPQSSITQISAEYYLRNGSHYVMFEETQEGFTEKVKGMLKIKKGSVELSKKGLIQSHMLFEDDLRYASEYRTPFGSFMMDVCTHLLNVTEGEDKIAMEIKYSLETEGRPVTDCFIKITITEKQPVG